MFLYISIVFIAELIIVASLILSILRLNRKVVTLNSAVIAYRPTLQKGLKKFADVVQKLQQSLVATTCAVKQKRNEYSWKLIQSTAITLLSLFAKGKYKKLALLLELIGAIQRHTSNSRV